MQRAYSLRVPLRPLALVPLSSPQVAREDLIQHLRRVSRNAGPGGQGPGGGSGTSSAFRGVSRHAKGRWESRIGLPPVDGKRRYK